MLQKLAKGLLFSGIILSKLGFSQINCEDPNSIESKKDWLFSDSKVFSKLVGSWKGEWRRYDSKGDSIPYIINGEEVLVKTSILHQSIDKENNLWRQTNVYDQEDFSRNFVGRVLKDGGVIFHNCADEGYERFEAVAREYGDYHIFWVVKNIETGIVIYTEDISLTTANERSRIGRRYNYANGEYVGLTVIHEERID
ncbi:MAG: hypothetical protein HRU19_16145 [Pseudobacteriovorax sp.]|nr:hypothetical protein [Pseudobacteriovorax sp.]